MTTAKVKISILVDNQAGIGWMGEHGLSLWIEAEDRKILFDTGQGIALATNARASGVDLAKTEILVLSHGHYDHTGGVAQIINGQSPEVYCHSGVVRPRYAICNGLPTSIQMPCDSKSALDRLSSRHLHWVQAPVRLSDTIGITGPISRQVDFEDAGGPFFLDPMGRRADPIEEDIALWIRMADGLVVVVGCCHAGLVNTLNYIQDLNDGLRIRSIIGGFHLLNANRRRLDETAAALRLFDPERVVPCHCTGSSAVSMLRDTLGERVTAGAAGMVVNF